MGVNLIYHQSVFFHLKKMLCGGWSGIGPANGRDQELLELVRPTIESYLKKTFQTITAVQSKSQVVNGTNYLIKGKFDDEYIVVLIHEPWSNDEKPYARSLGHGPHITEHSEF